MASRDWRVDRTWRGERAHPSEWVQVRARRDADRLVVEVDAPLHGDPAPATPPGSTWGLWQFEVVELFVRCGSNYLEIELGPHGHFLVLSLRGPRRVQSRIKSVRYQVQRSQRRWRGRAEVPVGSVPVIRSGNAYAIHGTGAERRFLTATALGGPRPDFHRVSRFPATCLF